MSKNFLIITIIITIIAVGAGGFILGKYYSDISKEATKVYESGPDVSKITEKETGECASIQNINVKNQCWIELAKEEKDESHCKKISADFPEIQGNCYAELAILKNDSLICEKIDSISLHKSCLEYFEDDDEKDETANWKVYQNKEYGFEMKYPKDFFTEQVLQPKTEVTQCDYANFINDCPMKIITVNDVPFCPQETGSAAAGTAYTTYNYTTIRNKECFAVSFAVSYPNCSNFLPINNQEIQKAYDKCILDNEITKPKIINQILSTFKFTE